MPLTPADVHNVAFSKPPIGKRGYNEDEVDQFLDLVEDTLAEIQEENDDLRQQTDELKSELEQARAGGGGGGGADEAAIRARVEAQLKQKFNAGQKELGCAVVCNGFHFTCINAECRLKETFPVAGGKRSGDIGSVRYLPVERLQHRYG